MKAAIEQLGGAACSLLVFGAVDIPVRAGVRVRFLQQLNAFSKWRGCGLSVLSDFDAFVLAYVRLRW